MFKTKHINKQTSVLLFFPLEAHTPCCSGQQQKEAINKQYMNNSDPHPPLHYSSSPRQPPSTETHTAVLDGIWITPQANVALFKFSKATTINWNPYSGTRRRLKHKNYSQYCNLSSSMHYIRHCMTELTQVRWGTAKDATWNQVAERTARRSHSRTQPNEDRTKATNSTCKKSKHWYEPFKRQETDRDRQTQRKIQKTLAA